MSLNMPAAFSRETLASDLEAERAALAAAAAPSASASAAEERSSRKRRFAAMVAASDSADAHLDEAEMQDIMALVDSAAEVKELDEPGVRVLCQRLRKALAKNVKQRAKYADAPEKFMESELALDEAITSMHALAVRPDLYGAFVRVPDDGGDGALALLLTLLAHENADIRNEVIKLLQELCDVDASAAAVDDDDDDDKEGDGDDGAAARVQASLAAFREALLAANFPAQLVSIAAGLDEAGNPDDSALLHSIFSIIESLLEGDSQAGAVYLHFAERTPLVDTIFNRLRSGAMDENQLYGAELLSVLVQGGGRRVQKAWHASKGVKKAVRLLGRYRQRDPESGDEVEYVNNLFNALCKSLDHFAPAQAQFLEVDGPAVMCALVKRASHHCYVGGLKTLNYAVDGAAAVATSLVDAGGLKILFACFMNKLLPRSFKKALAKSGDEATARVLKTLGDVTASQEHCVAIIASCFTLLADVPYERLMRKFRESDYAKTERLVELFDTYMGRVLEAEKAFVSREPAVASALAWLARQRAAGGAADDDEDPDEMRALLTAYFYARMDGGLYTAQMIALTLGFLCTAGDEGLFSHVTQQLQMQARSLDAVNTVLAEYELHIPADSADDDGTDAAEAVKKEGDETMQLTPPRKKVIVRNIIRLLQQQQQQAVKTEVKTEQ